MSLCLLPPELIARVGLFLPPESILGLIQTSRRFSVLDSAETWTRVAAYYLLCTTTWPISLQVVDRLAFPREELRSRVEAAFLAVMGERCAAPPCIKAIAMLCVIEPYSIDVVISHMEILSKPAGEFLRAIAEYSSDQDYLNDALERLLRKHIQ